MKGDFPRVFWINLNRRLLCGVCETVGSTMIRTGPVGPTPLQSCLREKRNRIFKQHFSYPSFLGWTERTAAPRCSDHHQTSHTVRFSFCDGACPWRISLSIYNGPPRKQSHVITLRHTNAHTFSFVLSLLCYRSFIHMCHIRYQWLSMLFPSVRSGSCDAQAVKASECISSSYRAGNEAQWRSGFTTQPCLKRT